MLQVLLFVTPFAGVWIEILVRSFISSPIFVTPFAGVWIEIEAYRDKLVCCYKSLPSRECGLKLRFMVSLVIPASRHSLRGSVD